MCTTRDDRDLLRYHPLLAEPPPLPPTGPFSDPDAAARRVSEYRERGLTEAEALTWFLHHDLGCTGSAVARIRGVTTRTVSATLGRARWKLDREGRDT